MAPPVRSVEFFLDPMCPWAYQTSRWIREVRDTLGVGVRWRFFSLEEINREEGKKHPWERPWSYGWSLMRVGALLRREDEALVDAWYAATGAALFDRGEQPHRREVAEALAAELGRPDAVERALADGSTAEEVRADHDELVRDHAGFGVPTLVFPEFGRALFGPVVVPPPTGPAALRLWQLVTGWLEFPDLYELRAPKTALDWARISERFEPYVRARSWRTVQRPVA
jgi:2-hydroxychromene-2-carboxylate isomerase